jgi:hypothetical protein
VNSSQVDEVAERFRIFEEGTHLWADRFDGSLEDVFELQDKVASSVAGVIEPALQAAVTTLEQPSSAVGCGTHEAGDKAGRLRRMAWSGWRRSWRGDCATGLRTLIADRR